MDIQKFKDAFVIQLSRDELVSIMLNTAIANSYNAGVPSDSVYCRIAFEQQTQLEQFLKDNNINPWEHSS